MARKKVQLAYITNDSARKAAFRKRKKSLMKKVSQLSTLCGIDACAIVCSPDDPQPEVWPSASEVEQVLSRFKNMPETEQSKYMMTQESYLRQRIEKVKGQLKEQRKKNHEEELAQAMFQCMAGGGSLQNLNRQDLIDLGRMVDNKLKEVQMRMETLTMMETGEGTGDSQAWTSNPAAVTNNNVGETSHSHQNPQRPPMHMMNQQQPQELWTGDSQAWTSNPAAVTNNNVGETSHSHQNPQRPPMHMMNQQQPQEHVGFSDDDDVFLRLWEDTTNGDPLHGFFD